VIPTGTVPSERLRPILEVRAPVVLIQPHFETALPTVEFDVRSGVDLLVRHLAGLGHRGLLWVGPPEEGAAGREIDFMRAVWDAGLRGESARWEAAATDEGRHERPRARAREAMAKRLAAGALPTAVVCYNDEAAAGVVQALLSAGKRIPGDVSVTGFDNVEAELVWPPLTTIDHRFGEMGYRATEILIEMVRGGEEVREAKRGYREVLAPQLVVRESTGPAPSTDD
jgi:DNA-binding LacI/PurR family transcriptional regulator